MKKLTLFPLLVFMLSSCQMMSFDDEDINNDTAKREKTMNFRLTPYKMTNLDELATGNDDMASRENALTDETRATQNSTDHLLMGIYDTEGNLVDTIAYQDKDDASLPEYGTFKHTLKYGRYTILALGWNGQQACTVHRPDSITFSEGWVPHTFLCRQNIIVSESYSDTRSLSLKRCIAQFTLHFKDANFPKGIRDFVFNISGAGASLNAETRHCTRQADFTRTIDIPADVTKIKSLTSYCFLPVDSIGIRLSITAHDIDGNTLGERTFEDVPMKINYVTNYSGNFFPYGDVDGDIEVDEQYDGEINVEF